MIKLYTIESPSWSDGPSVTVWMVTDDTGRYEESYIITSGEHRASVSQVPSNPTWGKLQDALIRGIEERMLTGTY